MKHILTCILFLQISGCSFSQSTERNIVVITTDGFRWQELFKGADSSLIRDDRYVKDTSIMMQLFWDTDTDARRKKLMPFFGSVLAKQGQLYGNRDFENEVNVSNLYKISYPGYNEIFTGYADKLFIPNLAVSNRNRNVLEYLNTLNVFNGRIAAFCSWKVLPFILNESGSNIPVNGGYEMLDERGDTVNSIINQLQENIHEKGSTRHDLLTFESAKNYMEQKHPKILYLGLGETDEAAHHREYDRYLQKAHQADAMIADLWYYVQTDPFYKNNTTFIITTDHGRGSRPSNWMTHGFWVNGSGQTWMAMIGRGIEPAGEIKEKQRLYQKQIAATIASLLGETFTANHPVAPALLLAPANTLAMKNCFAIAQQGK
jgi:flagellar biosynthesis/type III secretory pathway chaperone